MAKTEVNVSAVIDAGSLNRYQIGVFFLCGLFLIMDGFDVQSMGYVAPAIITEWKIQRETLTPVLMSGLFGLFIGSMLFGMLGDRIGRRRVLLGATVAFSIFTLLSARANSLTELGIIRFFAGFGLGAVLPNATALIGEFSPSRMRIATMMIVTNGFTVGAALGARSPRITIAIMQQVGVGIIGFGRIGAEHAAWLTNTTGIRAVAVADGTPARQDLAQQRGLRVYTVVEELLDDRDVSAVLVATPTAMHHHHAMQA